MPEGTQVGSREILVEPAMSVADRVLSVAPRLRLKIWTDACACVRV